MIKLILLFILFAAGIGVINYILKQMSLKVQQATEQAKIKDKEKNNSVVYKKDSTVVLKGEAKY